MRKKLLALVALVAVLTTLATPAFSEVSQADANYAQTAGKATQDFSTAIGNWGAVYQGAPDKFNSPEYKSWMKKALAADLAVKSSLKKFSAIKVTPGFKKSDVLLRQFVKSYNNAIDLYAPAIKKNDKKLIRKANEAIMNATTLFTKWGNEFARDSANLSK
jgi:hypothetical protein